SPRPRRILLTQPLQNSAHRPAGNESWWTQSLICGYLLEMRPHGKEQLLAASSGQVRPRPLPGSKLGRRSAKAAIVTLLGCMIGLTWFFRTPWFAGNLGVVDPDKVIRSAQPTSVLKDWAHKYRLKSVLNLRGGGPSDPWYPQEIADARQCGVAYYDLPLNATR